MGKNQEMRIEGELTRTTFTCSVCGEPLYPTDQCNLETTLHCSSAQARFWDFERGSLEQQNAKDHWDKSRKSVHLNHI
jgi:hypothetical protein